MEVIIRVKKRRLTVSKDSKNRANMLVNINDTVNEGDESTEEKITMKFIIKEKGTQCS